MLADRGKGLGIERQYGGLEAKQTKFVILGAKYLAQDIIFVYYLTHRALYWRSSGRPYGL